MPLRWGFLCNFAKNGIRFWFCTRVYIILQGCLPPKKTLDTYVSQIWQRRVPLSSTYVTFSYYSLQEYPILGYLDKMDRISILPQSVKDIHHTHVFLTGISGRVYRLVFWKHKNIKTYLPCQKNPEKYLTPFTGTKCKNIVSHIPFVQK